MLGIYAATDVGTPPSPDETAQRVQGDMAYVADVELQRVPYVTRLEARQRAMASLRGLLSPAERKNRWPLAAVIGDAPSYGCQPLGKRADGEGDALIVQDSDNAHLLPG